MNLKLLSIKNDGDHEKERVLVRALSDCSIGNYILFDTTYFGDNTVSNQLRHNYWLPNLEVKKGDLIVIYTKEGENVSKENDKGNTSHFLYWGIERPIWNDKEDCAVLIEISDWSHKTVK